MAMPLGGILKHFELPLSILNNFILFSTILGTKMGANRLGGLIWGTFLISVYT